MRFEAVHEFPADPHAVARLMTDPDFARGLALPDLSPPEVVEHHEHAGVRVLALRYEYTGRLDPIAERIVGRHRLSWLQELTIDMGALSGRLTMTVEADPKRARGDAALTLARVDTATRRTLAGEFVVRVPLVGGRAEKSILPGVLRRLDLEAEALVAQLRAPG